MACTGCGPGQGGNPTMSVFSEKELNYLASRPSRWLAR